MRAERAVAALASSPQLTDLASAIRAAGLARRINRAREMTVFAPDNAAFAALGAGNLQTLMASRPDLSSVLKYHLVTGRVTPRRLAAGRPISTLLHMPVQPGKSGAAYTLNTATVICGNIRTANATIYILNKVLIPTK
jgi:uncharacterized surface protein with fasciclin (FAS1) repeats